MYASTSAKASASSGGMTSSRASRPTASARVKTVSRSQASLKNRIRPSSPRTQTSEIVVSVRNRAKKYPSTKSGVLDIEQCHFVVLEREPRSADGLRRQLAQLLPGVGA